MTLICELSWGDDLKFFLSVLEAVACSLRRQLFSWLEVTVCVLLPVALREPRGSDQDQRPRVVWRQGGQGCSETALTFGDPGRARQFLRRVS